MVEVNEGATTSFTFTIKVHELVFPAWSVIVQTNVLSPASKTSPAMVVEAPPLTPFIKYSNSRSATISQLSDKALGSNSVSEMV